jgi:hypothetical protein
MLTHPLLVEQKPIVAGNKLAFGLQEVDQAARSEVFSRASVKTSILTKVLDYIVEKALAGVAFARIQHHLNDFMSVNLFHPGRIDQTPGR